MSKADNDKLKAAKGERSVTKGDELPRPSKSNVNVGPKKRVSVEAEPVKYSLHTGGVIAAYILWVIVAFYAVQFLLGAIVFSLVPESFIDSELGTMLVTALTFFLIIVAIVVIPSRVFKFSLRGKILETIGFEQRVPRWRDIGLALGAYVACLASAIGLAIAVQILFPSFDMSQSQSLPFERGGYYSQYALVWMYVTLAIVAPLAEEVIFRGYLFGKVRKFLPAGLTVVITAVVFGLMHVVGFDDSGAFRAQWNVVIGLLPLAIGLGVLREYTGSIWASVILHSIQNTLSFMLLFVVLPMQGIL